VTVNAGIDERYGRTPTNRKRDRRLLWGLGGVFAVVLVAWVVWAGFDAPSSEIEARDTRHEILDEHSVKVTFEVSMPRNSSASCAVEALNEGFTIIGWKVVDIPPSDTYTRSFTEIVRTTELSNTGLIYRCWLT
jgi:hypothetical protein